jgi:hypothetical protein
LFVSSKNCSSQTGEKAVNLSARTTQPGDLSNNFFSNSKQRILG